MSVPVLSTALLTLLLAGAPAGAAELETLAPESALEEIRKTDIDDVTLPILRRGSPSAANHCFEVIRAILNWGANKGYGGIEYSPMTGMKAPAPKGDGRGRVLSEEEIRTAWDWFENGSDMH